MKTMRRSWILAPLALVAALGVAPAQAQTRWDLPSAYPPASFHVENMTQFASDVDKASAGKLKITIHSNASLFKAPEIKRAVQGGQAQLGEILMVSFANEWPVYGVDGLPFLADSYDEAARLYKAQKPELEKKLASQGMMLLYSVPWPPQGIFSRKPVAATADLKGTKWRAYSPATSRIGELVGAQPVTVQQAELNQALATGVVDTFMTSGATGYDAKVFEQVKHYTDTQAWLPKNALLMNRAAYDALDKPTQAALLKAAADAEARGWKLSAQKNLEYIELLKKNGMQVTAPTPQLKAEMKKIGDTMLTEWLGKAGPEGKSVVDHFTKP
ncbi:TRAP-type C4-dicarboxylate transport system substrate-binding protein [Sphaerotilus hippei]|uniref:TRAP-type C4-dicarboxylate transport system substrate-binding protein n=2 Tax=Sphaerotilus hippei TaxID=744406 RepID=A0A318H6P5_9BURK|nr:TRAP-type C4-dicarboxylate transport system substrate-binding protein [Sphaerotilus hippei]